ncbi:beta-galactosidase [Arthrobacter sp. NicSoilC12]|uniref:beta-galactosidase n=1 Tax=Arthrobacter sp. NicSoilC12 TaxID=2831001 RepID=UPI001CC7EAB4|nr:beta-galactosidase [Arthrobacter sp. NicSoilC12]GIU56483.1 beta-galactosidase [Arthrobacter sp. NicSoilC12]
MDNSSNHNSAMDYITARLGSEGSPMLAFGGDYNPEQWPEETWDEDVRLMREAGVNLVSVGIFSWSLLEPSEGVYEFGWLDRVLDLLHANGIRVDLANATASPPPWFSHKYPESLPVTADGVRHSYGSRQAFAASSAEYRRAAAALTEQIATRYKDHPAVVMWHVHNEYGCHNQPDFSDGAAAGFRRWLERRYGSLEALNAAWGTAFWSQRYSAWEQILPPRTSGTWVNPTQQLDFARYSSDELLECYKAEAAIIRTHSGHPVTTNFMGFNMGLHQPVDYWRWSEEMDVVSNDHYLIAEDPRNFQELAATADLTRGWAKGKPWLLMEHSTSAVNWQPRNIAKAPGEMLRNSLQHVARGADGALFFQWRASRAGAEKFHSGLLPHAGTDTKVWREVVQLGQALRSLAEVSGSVVTGASGRVDVAILHDTDARWASELDSHPSVDASNIAETRRWHDAFYRAGIPTDFRQGTDDLSGYRLVVAPMQYLVSDAGAANLDAYVRSGGHLVVTYFSGIVDENDHIRLGSYPGAFSGLLGVKMEEFFPLRGGESIRLSSFGAGTCWNELGHATTAEVLAAVEEGPAAGSPAVTRNRAGSGRSYYVATSLAPGGLGELLAVVCADARVQPLVPDLPADVEVVRRSKDGTDWTFCINHGAHDVRLPLEGVDLLTGAELDGGLGLAAGGAAVVRSAAARLVGTSASHSNQSIHSNL